MTDYTFQPVMANVKKVNIRDSGVIVHTYSKKEGYWLYDDGGKFTNKAIMDIIISAMLKNYGIRKQDEVIDLFYHRVL